MALRNQPYLPLYVQDFLTDEKLNECSAESTGVYIRLMCIMHKSENYGTILLKQKDKQTDNQIKNFAMKLARQMPFTTETIEYGLRELVEEGVIEIKGETISQKRMVRDANLSDIRSSSGRTGGKNSSKSRRNAHHFASDFATANNQANTESVSVIINDTESKGIGNEGDGSPRAPAHEALEYFCNRMNPAPSDTAVSLIIGYEETMSSDVVKAAIDYCLDERKTGWSYLHAILRNWESDGVKCLADVQARDKKYRRKAGEPNAGPERDHQRNNWELSGVSKY